MAFAATQSTSEPRAISLGVIKMEIQTYTAISGDTAGTITASSMERLEHIVIDGIVMDAAPTFSGKVATISFPDPVANRAGTIILIGR